MNAPRPTRSARSKSATPWWVWCALIVLGMGALLGQIVMVAILLFSDGTALPPFWPYFLLTLLGAALYGTWNKNNKRRLEHPPFPFDSTVAKVLDRWQAVSAILAVGLFVYGIAFHLKSPIRPQGAGYVDKGNNARTRADYLAFRRWEHALGWAFPAMFWTMGCVGGAVRPLSKKQTAKRRRIKATARNTRRKSRRRARRDASR